MKRKTINVLYIFLFFMIAMLSSCQAIADIFKAGMWTGIILVALVVGVIIYIIGKSRKQ